MVDNERELYRAHQDGLRQYRLFSPRCDGGRDRIRSEPDAGCTTCGRTRTARRRAVVLWGWSFYLACRHLQSANTSLYTA